MKEYETKVWVDAGSLVLSGQCAVTGHVMGVPDGCALTIPAAARWMSVALAW